MLSGTRLKLAILFTTKIIIMKQIEKLIIVIITALVAVMFFAAMFRESVVAFELVSLGVLLSLCVIAIKVVSNEKE